MSISIVPILRLGGSILLRAQLKSFHSRFLIVPGWHVANLGSRVLALCQRRLASDEKETWVQRYAAIPQDSLPPRADARRLLRRATLGPPYLIAGSSRRLTADQMQSLPAFFPPIPAAPPDGDIACPRF